MKKSDFDNLIHISNQNGSEAFAKVVDKLDQKFDFRSAAQSEDFTGPAFTELYQITINFYKAQFPILYHSYIPIYFSLWKLMVKDVIGINNMHNDGGIQYFGKNGYQSRMVNVWTNLYKDNVNGLSDDDLGIYVIDNKDPHNLELYEIMAQKNTHFYQKGPRDLFDIRQIGNISISYDLDLLRKRYFDYSPGTTIQFNSHLLHGTKSLEIDKLNLNSNDLDKFRVSLVSVWVHKDDFNQKILKVPEKDYEQLYLSGFIKDEWQEMKDTYSIYCEKEIFRLQCITELVRTHLSYNNPLY